VLNILILLPYKVILRLWLSLLPTLEDDPNARGTHALNRVKKNSDKEIQRDITHIKITSYLGSP